MKLDKIVEDDNINKNDINDIVTGIGSLFKDCADKTFGQPKSKAKNKQHAKYSNFKPWFNIPCIRARNLYHKTRKMYNRYKSDYYKNMLKAVSTNYKKTLSLQQKCFKDNKISKLKSLKKNDPKEYWNIINSAKKSDNVSASLKDFYTFFKNVNSPDSSNGTQSDDTSESQNFNLTPDIENSNELNQPITESKIISAVKSLKNNKSPGLDNIINEHVKSTLHIMVPIYIKLFNIIFDSGIIPESWTCGVIKPIYKNKGSPEDPSNYRPITLLSCIGKLFTAIINNRLKLFTEKHDLIGWAQSGFRKGYATTENVFILKCLMDMMQASKKRLYCCFVDFKQAFDTVWRVGLWKKIIEHGVTGKCFKLIYNLYKDIKSQVRTKEGSTLFFDCNIGVRQGENLSPILFIFYLNDLESFLFSRQAQGININVYTNDTFVYFKLLILLYADDTVIFSDNIESLQHALNVFEDYCKTWKLQVNVSKTKIVIFGCGKISKNIHFTFQNNELEIAESYKHLGIYLSRTGTFAKAKKHIAEQANKALFSLLKKIRSLSLPYDIQIDLFDKLVKPILLYGCEIRGSGNIDILERIQLKFYKFIFNLKTSTPSYMIYGELGITPLYIDVQTRMVSFWSNLIENHENCKLSSCIYSAVHALHKEKKINSQWINSVSNILCMHGFSGVWYQQSFANSIWLQKAIKQKLTDVYIQKWISQIKVTSESNCYKIFKTHFGQSKYISTLPRSQCKSLIRFRTRNHKLPVEVGRWKSVPLNERLCIYCNELGDEFHYLMSCKHFEDERKQCLKSYFYKRPNIIKFEQLLNLQDDKQLKKLCRFINVIVKQVG